MTCKLFLIPFAVLVLAAGCRRETHAPEADLPETDMASQSTAAPEAATTTTIAQSRVQPVTGDFDRKAFAGTFTGTLPCADCPGIDETLHLGADGNFELTDVYRERAESTNVVRGRWSAEVGAGRIRLASGNERNVDRMYAIDDNDTLTQLGMDGMRIDSGLNFSLKRGR